MGAKPSAKKHRFGLTGKLVISILAVGSVPIILGLSVAYLRGTLEIREVIGGSFVALAEDSASKIDAAIDTLIQNNLQLARRAAADPKVQDVLSSLASVDGNGAGDSVRFNWPPVAEAESNEQALLTSWVAPPDSSANETPVAPQVTGLHLEKALQRFAFRVSVPVRGRAQGELIGWLHRAYDAREFLNPLVFPIRFGKTGHVMLVDSAGTVISCPLLPTGTRVPDAGLIASVTEPDAGWITAESDGHGGHATSLIGHAPLKMFNQLRSGDTTWATFVWQDSREIFAPAASLRMGIGIAGILALGLLGVLGFYAGRRIVGPIRRLRAEAAHIAGGDLDRPLTIRTGDEIEDLADQFDDMREQLRRFIGNLEETVETRTQELEHTREEKDQVVQQLIQAEKMAAIGTMASGIGHEINNPLYAIVGRAEAIRDATGPDRSQALADEILKYSEKIATVVKDFSGYARPGAPTVTQVDVNGQLEEALAMARHSLAIDGVEAHLELGASPPIQAKPDEIRQAFFNVIRNGIQAMQGKGTLTITSRHEGDRVRVVIKNTGPGISEAHLGKVFDPFFTTKGPDEGEGLGLYIVQQIVTKYGGTVTVDSPQDEGVAFTFEFPAG